LCRSTLQSGRDLGIAGAQQQRLLQIVDREIDQTEFGVELAAPLEGQMMLRLELDRPGEVGNRVVVGAGGEGQLTAPDMRDAQIADGRGVSRAERHRLAVVGDRRIEIAGLAMRDAAIVVGDRQGLADQLAGADGLGVVAHGGREVALSEGLVAEPHIGQALRQRCPSEPEPAEPRPAEPQVEADRDQQRRAECRQSPHPRYSQWSSICLRHPDV